MTHTTEELQEMIEEKRFVIDTLGMIDFQHYLRFKVNAAQGMMEFGDQFFRSLGETLAIAPTKQSVRIIRVWQQDCVQFEMLHKMQVAKTKALADAEKSD